jgi:hypothetical protein
MNAQDLRFCSSVSQLFMLSAMGIICRQPLPISGMLFKQSKTVQVWLWSALVTEEMRGQINQVYFLALLSFD